MSDRLNIYECDELLRQIEAKVEANDGELSDEDLKSIVEAQTQSTEQLEKLANYVKYLEGYEMMAKAEVVRIQAKRKTIANRIEGIKRWLRPYIERHGPVDAGVRRISPLRSQGVVLVDGFNDPVYGVTETMYKPDKKLIKQALKSGVNVKGAVLENRINIQIR